MMEKNYVFIKSTYHNTHKLSKKKVFLKSLYFKKRKISIYLTKTILKTMSNAIFKMKKVDLDES